MADRHDFEDGAGSQIPDQRGQPDQVRPIQGEDYPPTFSKGPQMGQQPYFVDDNNFTQQTNLGNGPAFVQDSGVGDPSNFPQLNGIELDQKFELDDAFDFEAGLTAEDQVSLAQTAYDNGFDTRPEEHILEWCDRKGYTNGAAAQTGFPAPQLQQPPTLPADARAVSATNFQQGDFNGRADFNYQGSVDQRGNLSQYGNFYQQGSTFMVAPTHPQACTAPHQNSPLPGMPSTYPSYGAGPSKAGVPLPGANTAAVNGMAYHQPQPQGLAPPPLSAPQFSDLSDHNSRGPPARQSRAPENFRNMQATIKRRDTGHLITGTNQELYDRYPVMRPKIQETYEAWKQGTLGQPQDVQQTATKQRPSVSVYDLDAPCPQSVGHSSKKAAVSNKLLRNEDAPAHYPARSYASTPQSTNFPTPHPSDNNEERSQDVVVFPDDDDVDFDLEHESIDNAHEYIERPFEKDCLKLNIEEDDWEDLANFSDEFKSLCRQLFNALRHPGDPMPDSFSDKQKTAYDKKQGDRYNQVKGLMATPEKLRQAKARVIKAIAAIVRMHEVGVPKTTWEDQKPQHIEDKVTCKERAQKVIHHTKICKYIAVDILKSVNLVVFALCPEAYLQKKYQNNGGNTDRGEGLKRVNAEKKAEKVATKAAGGPAQLMADPVANGARFNAYQFGHGHQQEVNVYAQGLGWEQNPNYGGPPQASVYNQAPGMYTGDRGRGEGEMDIGDSEEYGGGGGSF